ncbi:biopolymer transporter ExbD [Malikia sp.]|uniref:ExbD/TolR family protein n=1 Tax=Malikia sp. TaxID=2070706 RepID=UPI002612EDCD|nr:biopolymer transporter ExbD [Malikia sp.]MDD2728473.1 biopolymer transporter ExbD [Malikia sp.]
MAFGQFDDQDDDQLLGEINMVPLIDVMLVLLIVFIVTLPVINHAVKVDLPKAAASPSQRQAVTIDLTVDAQGQYHWNREPVSDEALRERLTAAALRQPQPELHIRGDKAVPYERVAQLLAAAQRAGLTKLGFVTEP